jgi:ankyrin repeat protein
MKSIITVTFRKTAIIMLSIILGCSGCGNRQSGAANERSQTIETGTVETPDMDIFTAALLGNLKAINNHIKAGTDLNQKDEYGSTPLIIAATFGKTDVAIALIDAGADLNLKSDEGSTPLHTAAFFCRKEITNALLEKGADKTLKNAYGSTPYESVTAPYEAVKPIYDQIAKDLGPLGLKLDYDQIQKNRLMIAEMLK